MVVKSLHQFLYYHSKYLNSRKCQEISMGPSIHIIQCSRWGLSHSDHLVDDSFGALRLQH
jgi:hypothetical protein